MSTLNIILLAVCSALAIAFIVVRAKIGGTSGLLIKTLASFGFVASAIITLGTQDFLKDAQLVVSLIAVGLLFGMIGDIILDLKVIYKNDSAYLNAGMLSFGLGHLCYFSAFSLNAVENKVDLLFPILISIVVAISITVFIILSSKKMKLNFGKFLTQTIAYTFILSFMTVYLLILAITQGAHWLAFIGMLLFFASDIVLSFQYFGGKLENKLLIVINHALYYAAQIIILATLMIL